MRQIFAGILVCMARKLNEAWRKKTGADSVLRDFKQALRRRGTGGSLGMQKIENPM